MMISIWEFLTFKKMVSPLILQILFWAGIAGTLYGAHVLYMMDNWAYIFPLILGPLIIRVIFERIIISFRSYDRLCDIANGIGLLEAGNVR